jgi:carbonic anhydrase
MSCPNSTAPIDITNNNASNCELKCNYNFNYPLTSVLTVANRGDYLSLRIDKSDNTPVTYNADNYEVRDVRIYKPSLHTYGGSKADAEMIISHINTSGGNNLLICVPIVVGASAADTSTLFDTILSDVAKYASSLDKYTIINSPTFTLNKFIPMKPFYSYNGSLPYSPCNGSYNYVVFSKEQSNVYMSQNAFNVLNKIIKSNLYTTKNKTNKNGLFYNEKGPTALQSINGGGDIYIECTPTGASGESLVPVTGTQSLSLLNFGSAGVVVDNLFFKIFIGILVIYIIMEVGKYILGKITDINIPSIKIGGVKVHINK